MQRLLKHFFVHDFYHEIKVFHNFLTLLVDQLLLGVVLGHECIVLPLGFKLSLFLSLLLLLLKFSTSKFWLWRLEGLDRLFDLLVKRIGPFVFELCLIEIFDLHLDVLIVGEVFQD